MSAVPRTRLSLYAREFPGWERLREALAHVLGVSLEDTRGLLEPADPAVRVDARASVLGLRLTIDLYIDPRRARVPDIGALAVALAANLGQDTAHHDGSQNPYGYVLVRPNGERFAATELDGDGDGLVLDESAAQLRALPRLPVAWA